jgi:TonB family protein
METLIYLAKVNAYWLLFYACYWFLLRKHTFFQWNRIFLLGSLLIAFALPAVRFAESITTIHVPETIYQKATISVQVVAGSNAHTGIHFGMWIAGVYMLVTLYFSYLFFRGLYQVYRTVKRSERIELDGCTLVLLSSHTSDRATSSFSFFQWLFLSAHDYRYNLDTVLQHEFVHIRQRHTIDILLIEGLKMVFWFNPVLWLYKRSIETVHEYLADQPVATRENYASFLLSYAMHSPDIPLVNHFFKSSLLKSRIKMIYKKRSSPWLLTRYLLVLPVIAGSLFITASKAPLRSIAQLNTGTEQNITVKGNVTDENNSPVADAIIIVAGSTRGTTTDANGWFELKNVSETAQLAISHVSYEAQMISLNKTSTELIITLKRAVNKITGPVVVGRPINAENAKTAVSNPVPESADIKVVEQHPEFPGGREALMAYLLENLEYPATARKTNVEAIALVSFTVDKNGDIRNAKSLKTIGFGIDKEALRVVNEMPRWNPAVQNGKPVEMEYTLEINFKIEKDNQDKRQGFTNFNTNGVSLLPNMDEIGALLHGKLNLSASGEVPEATYGRKWDLTQKTAPNGYVDDQTGKYRYMKYGGTYMNYRRPIYGK